MHTLNFCYCLQKSVVYSAATSVQARIDRMTLKISSDDRKFRYIADLLKNRTKLVPLKLIFEQKINKFWLEHQSFVVGC